MDSNSYKNIESTYSMNIKKKIGNFHSLNFYSDEMIITKKSHSENQLKYTYQKRLISDLENKHKEWSRFLAVDAKNFR